MTTSGSISRTPRCLWPQFFDKLLNEIQVVGTPGEGFGACGEGFFRFSTFGDPADTREAADRLLALLRKS